MPVGLQQSYLVWSGRHTSIIPRQQVTRAVNDHSELQIACKVVLFVSALSVQDVGGWLISLSGSS